MLVACCVCSFPSIHASQTRKAVFETDTLYYCLLSLVFSLWSLSLVNLSHTPIVVYICLIVTENSSVFNLCCTEPMQHDHIHSIHSPFTHLLACKTHSHSADHSLIPQAHAIIPLHDYKAYKTRSRETKLGALWFHANTRLKMSPPPPPSLLYDPCCL